jgi:hypothetical protein
MPNCGWDSYIIFEPIGTYIVSNEKESWNTSASNSGGSKPLKVTDTKPTQSANASVSIVSTPAGIVTEVKFLQL